jgi:hypothetical protein
MVVPVVLLTACNNISDVLIGDNAAPPDSTVDNVTISNYINKLYISTLGREPSDSEFSEAQEILSESNVSLEIREEVVDTILALDEYYERTYEIAFSELLNETNENYVEFLIMYYYDLLENETEQAIIDFLTNEVERLEMLQETLNLLKSEEINMAEMYKRIVNNSIYDDINMGTENFIVSVFQFFLLRYPTDAELENATQIVDGSSGILFYMEGNSKDDFLEIFFGNDGYFEGQVILLYQRYLYRDPDSEEMSQLAIEYKNTGDYKALQKSILTLDEYVGL